MNPRMTAFCNQASASSDAPTGIMTSLPDAISTKAYVPILTTGVVFGAIAGWIVGRWAL